MNFVKNDTLKMRFLWKMILWKRDFCENGLLKCDFCEKMWCGFLDQMWIFTPVCHVTKAEMLLSIKDFHPWFLKGFHTINALKSASASK